MISYNVIAGDTVSKVVSRIVGGMPDESFFATREFAIVATTMFISLPLSLHK